MSNLTIFNFENNTVRILSKDGEPWFVAKDVCDALGLTNSRVAIESLDEDEKGVSLTYTLGGEQNLTIINESGLYVLILRSRKAIQQGTIQHKFRKWVTSEVLPQIRKTGSYTQATQTEQISYTPKTHEVEDDVLHTLFNLLFLAEAQAEQLRTLEIALQGTALKLSPTAYSLHSETSFVLGLKSNGLKDLLTSLSKESDEWQKTLGHFNRLQVTAKNKQHRLAIR